MLVGRLKAPLFYKKKSSQTVFGFQIVIFCQIEVNKKLTGIQPILNLEKDWICLFTGVGLWLMFAGFSKTKALIPNSKKRRAYEIHTSDY